MHAIEAQEDIIRRRHDLTQPTAVEFFNTPNYIALLSRGADLASACQGALLFKEVARMGAEPMSAAQFRHGPMEIVNPAHRYVIFARKTGFGRKSEAEKHLLRLAEEICGHGGRVLLYTDQPFDRLTNVRFVPVESVRMGLGTLVDLVHIQLLVHDLALRAGLEPRQVPVRGVARGGTLGKPINPYAARIGLRSNIEADQESSSGPSRFCGELPRA